MLASIRSDYVHALYEVEKALSYTPKWQEKFELKKFSPAQAAEVLHALAESGDLSFERRYLVEICERGLAKQDGTVSPADIQILAWLVASFQAEDGKGFNRAWFERKGGVEGLLENFLDNVIGGLSGKKRQDLAIKLLLALIDKEKGLRAGASSKAQIQETMPDRAVAEVAEMLDWLEDSKVRLVTAIADDEAEEKRYEIAHEKLIPGLLNLARRRLQGYDRANLLLDRRVTEWLGNGKHPRYLLSAWEYRYIRNNRQYLLWGERQADKQALLAVSKRRLQGWASVAGAALLSVSTAWVWWRFCPQGQIFECRRALEKLRDDTSGEAKRSAVKLFFALEDEEKNREWVKTVVGANLFAPTPKWLDSPQLI
jgi:hypothetical protein